MTEDDCDIDVVPGSCTACLQELILVVRKDNRPVRAYHPWNVRFPCQVTARTMGTATFHTNEPDVRYWTALPPAYQTPALPP